jgi:hypothetical protein
MQYEVYNFPTLPTTINGAVNTDSAGNVIGSLKNSMSFAT